MSPNFKVIVIGDVGRVSRTLLIMGIEETHIHHLTDLRKIRPDFSESSRPDQGLVPDLKHLPPPTRPATNKDLGVHIPSKFERRKQRIRT